MTLTPADLRTLTRYHFALRKFAHTSEEAVREVGLTPQHHMLLLGVAGFTGKGWATIGELADFFQVRHHSMVGLVDRAAELGLVRRQKNAEDRREVRVGLTAEGTRKLRALGEVHRHELSTMRRGFNLAYIEREGGVKRKASTRAARSRRR